MLHLGALSFQGLDRSKGKLKRKGTSMKRIKQRSNKEFNKSTTIFHGYDTLIDHDNVDNMF